MALDMSAPGRKIGPIVRDYNWKDVILYALAVGAGFDEFQYVYEKDLRVIPSFSVAAIFDFFWEAAQSAGINVEGVLHGEQEIFFHEPIPVGGTLTTEGAITDYLDKGAKGALIRAESKTVHSGGKILYTNVMTLFSRLDGGWGGKAGTPRSFSFPTRDPDYAVPALPSATQPLLYRLTGDYFPLHADPAFAAKSGFEKPIMHGMCTFGFACRALVGRLIPGKPEMTKYISCRFARPLYPGEPIRTLIWRIEKNRALWRVVHAVSGQSIIDHGLFDYES
jgi:acyl dehydratase